MGTAPPSHAEKYETERHVLGDAGQKSLDLFLWLHGKRVLWAADRFAEFDAIACFGVYMESKCRPDIFKDELRLVFPTIPVPANKWEKAIREGVRCVMVWHNEDVWIDERVGRIAWLEDIRMLPGPKEPFQDGKRRWQNDDVVHAPAAWIRRDRQGLIEWLSTP